MLNPDAKLASAAFDPQIERKSLRDGFGAGLVEAARQDERVVALTADLAESTRVQNLRDAFPTRFFDVGVAEQNLVTAAAGMAAAGKIPFVVSYAAFSPGRNYEQIRTTVALNQRKVVIIGSHAGVSVGADGATHEMLEDIGMMRMLPGMTVLAPADAEEARKATCAAVNIPGPAYIRLCRAETPAFTTPDTPFAIGKALTLWQSEKPRVTLIATGTMSYNALLAARALDAEAIGTTVIHVPTVKPLDAEAVIAGARRTGRVVTVEEHQVAGGFGSAIAECLAREYPVPVRFIGIQDAFGQSGKPDELLEHYGLSPSRIADAVRGFIQKGSAA